MKLIMAGVTLSAAQTRSPSFSRSSSSTRITILPFRRSSMISGTVLSMAPPDESGPGVEQEEGLAILHGLPVVDQDLDDPSRRLGLDLVHELHRLDDAEDLAFLDDLALAGERRGVGSGGAVEGADHGRLHREEPGRHRVGGDHGGLRV